MEVDTCLENGVEGRDVDSFAFLEDEILECEEGFVDFVADGERLDEET